MKKERIGSFLLIMFGVLFIVGMFFISPIVQSEDYHLFSDTKSVFGIPNFWNVISNLLFVIIGICGIYIFRNHRENNIEYIILFAGIILIGIGSGYYHFSPNTQSLIWDRLPMTIVFMTLFSIIISEFISVKLGKVFLWPLLLIGLGSIWWWIYGGMNDLRLYVLVQFYPVIAIPIILIFFKSKVTYGRIYWFLLAFYFLAKISEHYDQIIHNSLGIISGHTLKHLFSGLGLCILFIAYKRRLYAMNKDCIINH